MPSLHQLRTFVEIAGSGSVRAAAERLVVSQPAVSAALATLQREVGAPLFEREGRGLRLTESGKTLERYARRALALIDEGVHEAHAAAQADAGCLRVAAVTTAAEQVLPELLRGFRAHHGAVEVVLEVANRSRVWELLANWEVELVLAGRPPQGEAFRTLATRHNELVVVARPGRGRRGVKSLAGETWLLREPGSGTRLTTEEFFTHLSIAPPRLTIGSNGAIREGARCGLGVALLARDAVARDIADGRLEIVPTRATPLVRPWHVIASAERDLAPVVARFVDYLCSEGGFARAKAAPVKPSAKRSA
jgi:DNA-binding transcriptional LysR family regulator